MRRADTETEVLDPETDPTRCTEENARRPVQFYSKRAEGFWLSNFLLRTIWVRGRPWATTEHFFQAAKFTTPEDDEAWANHLAEEGEGKGEGEREGEGETEELPDENNHVRVVRLMATPREAFKEGRSRSRPRRPDWESVKEGFMMEALRAKFTQHQDLHDLLLGTGTRKLVEHTRNDRYWGDGGDGSGQNRLGILLMQLRDELRAAQEAEAAAEAEAGTKAEAEAER